MTGLITVLVLVVPSVLVLWLLRDGPLGRDLDVRPVPTGRRPLGRVYSMARVGGARRPVSTPDGRRPLLTIEPVGVVVPEVPVDPGAMVPAAGHAMAESRAFAAAEQSPAFQAAAASPA